MALGTVLTGCSLINEDQSDCGEEVTVDYEIRLVTNMSIELTTKLGTDVDECMAAALRRHLSGIFTDHANDIDLSFYDTAGDSARLHHEQHVMDASQQSYTIQLPKRDYMHLALANVRDNQQVTLEGDDHCHLSSLSQTVSADTISPHNTGLFAARQPISVREEENQSFDVRLYMANCAAALVVDPRGHDLSRLRVFATGFASAFSVSDSSYVFAPQPPIVRTSFVESDCGDLGAYCSVNFPSREGTPPLTPPLRGEGSSGADTSLRGEGSRTRTVIETEDPFVAQPGEKALWAFHTYYNNMDGSVTETVLGVREPLRAGQLMIIKAMILDDGSVVTDLPEVGVSVTLDWKPGNVYHPTL